MKKNERKQAKRVHWLQDARLDELYVAERSHLLRTSSKHSCNTLSVLKWI